MEDFKLTAERIAAYGHYLKQEERTPATLEKYLRDVRAFSLWLDGEAVDQGGRDRLEGAAAGGAPRLPPR